jgi:Zn-dependent protease
MLDTFLVRWRTLSRMQQLVILGVGVLVLYAILLSGGGIFSWQSLLAKVLILLFALPVHELAHAVAATALGDNTPRNQGRLTLNPLRHLDPMGAILLLIAGFGWAKPVQWNPRNVQINRRAASIIVASAGPLSNLLLAALSFVIVGAIGATSGSLAITLLAFAQINVLLAVFNLIPLPPLDGSHVLFAFLPGDNYRLFAQMSQFGFLIIFLIVFLVPGLITGPTSIIMNAMARVLL